MPRPLVSPLITWDHHETDSLIGIQQRAEHGGKFRFGVEEDALVAMEGHLSLVVEIQFPVGNSCKWTAPFFAERGTKTYTSIRLIYLPHNI